MAYYVLGSGGAKYGPVEIAQLNAWVTDGRVIPDTLLEDVGSGVKSPARSVRGLQFLGLAEPSVGAATVPPQPPRSQPFAGSTPRQMPAPTVLHSNYLRPGMGTSGSQSNLFLPGADAKWAWHGFACVGVALASALILSLMHLYIGWYIGKIVLFAFALPLFGVQRGVRGLQINRPLAILVIILNILAMLGALALVFRDLLA